MVIVTARTPDESRPARQHQTLALVPLRQKNIIILRPLTVFGHDDVPYSHMEILFEEVQVPPSDIILGTRRGFEIA